MVLNSSFNNSVDFATLITDANTLSDNYLGNGILVVVWVVLFFSAFKYGRDKALMFASFSSLLVTIFLYQLSLVSFWLFYVQLILMALGTFSLVTSSKY